MNYQIFDHTLTLNMTAEMRDDIDRALILVQDTLVRTRSEFLRVACQFALDSLAVDCGDKPVGVEERRSRVFSERDADSSDQVHPMRDNDWPDPHRA
jgi:hypothetical protein